jgi:hypothetical protein
MRLEEEAKELQRRDEEWARERKFADMSQQFDEFKNRYTLFSPVLKSQKFVNAAGNTLGGTIEIWACTAFNKDGTNVTEYFQFTRTGEGWSNWLKDGSTNWLFDGDVTSGTSDTRTQVGTGGFVTETIIALLPEEQVDQLLKSEVVKVQVGGFSTSLSPALKSRIELCRERRAMLIASE